MPPVTTADEATKIAMEFAFRYKFFVTPLTAKRTDDSWIVELDLGLFSPLKGWVKVRADTGTITEYQFPR